MSDAKKTTLRDRIEAGHARQTKRAEAESSTLDRLTTVAREHPLLIIAGGLAIGVALSTLIPKSPTRKLSKNAASLIATVAELGLAYSRQAFDSAEEASQPTRERLGEFGNALLGSASKLKDKVAAVRK